VASRKSKSADQWFYIVHGEDDIILGTPACHALGVIDDDRPISTLLRNLNHPSSVNTLDASENNPQICDNKPTEVDHLVPTLTRLMMNFCLVELATYLLSF
jgi:hypothetical protein